MSFTEFRKRLVQKDTVLSEMYEESLTYSKEAETKREIRLRASGLPSCSLITLDKLIKVRDGEIEEDTARMEFYTSIGTQVHEWVQKWIAEKGGVVYGHWNCPKCKHRLEWTTENICPTCKINMEYEEITLIYDIFSGHVDGVLKLPDPNTKAKAKGKGKSKHKYVVYDYKTTSAKNVETMQFIPMDMHLIQVCAYAAVLRKVHKHDVESVSIFYIARDAPDKFREFSMPFTDDVYYYTIKFLHRQIKGFKAAMKSFETGKLETAVKYKQCSSFEDYLDNYMKFMNTIQSPTGKYMGISGCHLAGVCFNRNNLDAYLLDDD